MFYLNECPITWCSQKQQVVSLSSCEAEFMAATEAAKQAIWLQDLFAEVIGTECERVVILVDNKSALHSLRIQYFTVGASIYIEGTISLENVSRMILSK